MIPGSTRAGAKSVTFCLTFNEGRFSIPHSLHVHTIRSVSSQCRVVRCGLQFAQYIGHSCA